MNIVSIDNARQASSLAVTLEGVVALDARPQREILELLTERARLREQIEERQRMRDLLRKMVASVAENRNTQ
jgi:hypothetical protein